MVALNASVRNLVEAALSIFAYPAIKGNVTNVRLLFRFHSFDMKRGKECETLAGKLPS